jgi:hypothetical protein
MTARLRRLAMAADVPVRLWRWICPVCNGDGHIERVPCWHCHEVGLTNQAPNGWPLGQLQPAPPPPAVMRTACRRCTVRPDRVYQDRPEWCHEGMWRRPDGRYQPVAYLGDVPLGAMICHRWWVIASAGIAGSGITAVTAPIATAPLFGGRLVGLNPWAVARWRAKFSDLPEPVVGEADSYLLVEVVAFLTRHRLLNRVPDVPLLSLADLARVVGVRSSAASQWRSRNPDFPLPAGGTTRYPLFQRDAALAWIVRHCRLDRVLHHRNRTGSPAPANPSPTTRKEQSA